jgi:hypothetical protein
MRVPQWAAINTGAEIMTSTFWYRLPAFGRIAGTGLFGLTAGIALSYLYYSVGGKVSAFGIAMAGFLTVVMLIAALWAERLIHRDFGSTQRYVVYTDALRSGELPAHIEPNLWRGWLARSRSANRQAPVMALLLVVFGVGHGLKYPSPGHLVIAGLLAVCTAAIVVNWHLGRGRIARLTTAVEQREE